MKVKIISLIIVIIAFCSSCLSSMEPGIISDNTNINTEPSDTDKYDLLSTRNITWLALSEDWAPVSMILNGGGNGLKSFWWRYITQKFYKIADEATVCLSVFVSPNAFLYTAAVSWRFEYNEKTYNNFTEYYNEILFDIMRERDPDLYERWEMIQTPVSKREEEKDYSFTEEEIEEAYRYYEECRILAENDERYKAGQVEYEKQIREFQEATKRNISKYLVYEKLFTDYGFEIAARYNDGGVLDRYLIDSQCPFAIIGTKEMIVDFVNNVIPEGREETTGMYFALGELPDPKTIDP